jgi:SHS2 domain-containing protein
VSIEVLGHTADVRIRVRAATLQGLFLEALRATMDLLQPQSRPLRVWRPIMVDSLDQTTLLIDFLNEALSNAHTSRETYHDVEFSSLTEHRMEGQLIGHEALSFGEEVKAVTYHQAEVHCDSAGMWQTIIVYDV